MADHLEMISSQYLASTLRPDQPSHAVMTAKVLGSFGRRSILDASNMSLSILPTVSSTLRITRKQLMVSTPRSSAAFTRQSPNRLLEATPPEVAKSELSLLLPHRTALTQMHSSKCMKLNNTLHRFGRAPSAVCPKCRYQ